MHTTEINPEQIDIDNTYYTFTQNRDDKILQKSIEAIGIQHPIILEEVEKQRYRIVSGSRRVAIALKIGLKLIFCDQRRERSWARVVFHPWRWPCRSAAASGVSG